MRISTDKTVILLSVKGSKATRAMKRHVRHIPGKGKFLLVPSTPDPIRLPIVQQHTYLGIQLSYTSPEQLTLKHRFKQSWTAFNRLLPALKSTSLTQQQKLKIWKACAYATLTYGLDCTGLAPAGATKLLQHVARQIRVILKSPVHLSRESSRLLLKRLNIPEPAVDIGDKIELRIRKCQQGPMQPLQPPRVQQRWTALLTQASLLKKGSSEPIGNPQAVMRPTPGNLIELPPTTTPIACSICGLYFPTLKSLKLHRALKHPVGKAAQQLTTQRRSQQSMRAAYMQYADGGVPTCVHCHWQLTSWPSFCQHFAKARCPVLHGPAPAPDDQPSEHINPDCTTVPTVPLPSQPPDASPEPALDQLAALLERIPSEQLLALQQGWQALAKMLRTVDQHVCPFCDQWLAKPQYLTRHLVIQHAVLQPILDVLPSWLSERRVTVHSPCSWCRTDFKAQHASRMRHTCSCPTLIRTGIIVLLHARQDPTADQDALGCSQGRAGASPEPGGHVQDVAEQHHLGSRRSLGAGSEHPAPADLAGDGPNAEGGQARRAVGGSEQGQPRTGRRQGQQQVAKAREGERRPIWQWLGISRPGLVGPTELPESKESPKLKDLCLAMSRLLLRHEDAQSIARSETGFVMFCQTKGLLSSLDLMKAAEVWKKAKAEMPETLTMPLQVAMLHSMLQIWHERMKVTMQSPESIATAKEMLILDGDCRVPYLQYNAQEKKMMIKTDRAPMEFQEVLTALETLLTLTILPLTVLRFHSTRRMEQDLKGEILPMVLEIGLRTAEADQAWSLFSQLCHSGACRVMAMSMRADKLGRSALATYLQKMTESMSEP